MPTERRHGLWWIPLIVVALIGAALAWLNRAPWWGWLLVVVSLALVGFAAWALRRRRWFVRGAVGLVSVGLVAGTALAVGPITGTRTLDGPHTEPVVTAQGEVVGIRDEASGVDAFAGIPYAAPPVGSLRWEAPQPALRHSEPLIADDFGPSAIQPEPSVVTRAVTRVADVPLPETLLGGYKTDEDSLHLNVWTPTGHAADADRPVLVFVHGGSFTGGSGAFPAYDGTSLASRGDAVVVTINYRLGVFGFLAADALGGGTPGNQGLLDQLAAVQWVHDNIAAFGGDPGRVTVSGESAGSGSACILGASPLAAGLVHGIIGESGGCLGSAGDRDDGDLYDTAATARQAADDLSEALGGASLAEMQQMPTKRIAEAAESLTAHWWPSVDGAVLPDTPAAMYDAGLQNDVPLLLGSNADETSISLLAGMDDDPAAYVAEAREKYGDDADRYLELYPGDDPDQVVESRLRAGTDESMTAPMRRWATSAASTGASPVYVYHFTRTPPEAGLERYGAYHGSEVMYAYGNLGADGDADYTDVDRRLEAEMTGAWLSFVSHGDPNADGAVSWPTVQEARDRVLEFGDVTSVVARPAADEVDFWLGRAAG